MSAPRHPSRAVPLWILGALAALTWLALHEWKRDGEQVAPPKVLRAPAPTPSVHAPSSSSPPRRQAPVAAPALPRPPWPQPYPVDVESHCNGIGAFGICEADVAKACVSNAVYSVDCAARHMRCVVTDEGAQCLPSDPATDCSGSEPTVCDGSLLQLCVDGSFERIDCRKRGAECLETAEGARCASKTASSADKRTSGTPSTAADGTPSATKIEICDGHDNDADMRIDESDVCAAVPLVAFASNGHAAQDLAASMQMEIEILNRVYAPTAFRWAKTVSTDETYLHFDPKLMSTAARALARDALPSFYVAVLYVQDMLMDPPKGGMSTIPNDRCGGVRLTDHAVPADGLIVLTEARQPETLAHEMGHYLGLCHTHQQLAPLALADAQAAECNTTGDGICETPRDPGPSRCLRDAVCEVLCLNDDAEPSPINIMSYYIGCRQSLTPEQLTEARRNLNLRRGWFGCLDPTACVCTPGSTTCPIEMSCQPGPTSDARWTCRLDGAALPGAPCDGTGECARGSLCLETSTRPTAAARCVRPCSEDDDCNCIDIGLPFRICSDDMPGALAQPPRE